MKRKREQKKKGGKDKGKNIWLARKEAPSGIFRSFFRWLFLFPLHIPPTFFFGGSIFLLFFALFLSLFRRKCQPERRKSEEKARIRKNNAAGGIPNSLFTFSLSFFHRGSFLSWRCARDKRAKDKNELGIPFHGIFFYFFLYFFSFSHIIFFIFLYLSASFLYITRAILFGSASNGKKAVDKERKVKKIKEKQI